MEKYKVILFYKFINIDDPESLKKQQLELGNELNLKGRMLIGKEGVNGTFEGEVDDIEKYKEGLKKDQRFADILFKESDGNGLAFPKLKIKVRDEVVALGAGKFNPSTQTAPELSADELQKMYEQDEDFVVLDLRNDYEIKVGAFDKTIDPGLGNFRDLPEKLSELEGLKNKKIVTVCTGGIRCEKATCLMKQKGFKNIYQLKDGIHTYMQKYPGKSFKGSLFVFDNRMITDVTEIENKEIVGRCEYCEAVCETFYANDSVRPSKKIICCDGCYQKNKEILREVVSV